MGNVVLFVRFVEKIMTVRPIAYPIIKLVSSNLKINASKNITIEDHVRFTLSWHFLNLLTIKPSQVRAEINQLLTLISQIHPKTVLEIGTSLGGTLYTFSKVAANNATIISVDLPRGYPLWKIALYKSFAQGSQKIHLVQGNSHAPSTLSKVKKIINETEVDVLFIDGDHSYEGVKRDFEMYTPLVRNCGLVVFHDIVSGPSESVGGVPKFWSEIKCSYSYIEIVENWQQGGFGIGVLFLSNNV